MSIDWADTREAVNHAKGVSFDGCHKIYVLMDDEEVAEQRRLGYGEDEGSYLVTGLSPEGFFELVQRWFDQSCPLRFVNAVKTVPGDPNEGFTTLVGQFEDEEDEERLDDQAD